MQEQRQLWSRWGFFDLSKLNQSIVDVVFVAVVVGANMTFSVVIGPWTNFLRITELHDSLIIVEHHYNWNGCLTWRNCWLRIDPFNSFHLSCIKIGKILFIVLSISIVYKKNFINIYLVDIYDLLLFIKNGFQVFSVSRRIWKIRSK